ncbi:hypothetical protein DFH11DRAFT_630105 [Phellopilus nigrolimitatus]|nr:hypothetical protein DFH11DRAFT_630105 [Phellopilus nigrolimitatus]
MDYLFSGSSFSLLSSTSIFFFVSPRSLRLLFLLVQSALVSRILLFPWSMLYIYVPVSGFRFLCFPPKHSHMSEYIRVYSK